MVFIGSDGKDDLLIEKTPGTVAMNQDEALFLHCVEQNHGRLENLYDSLRRMGSITDDLSILRIQTKGYAYKEIGSSLNQCQQLPIINNTKRVRNCF